MLNLIPSTVTVFDIATKKLFYKKNDKNNKT